MNNETPTNPTPAQKPSTKKPVFIYIMILCIAAFLLMALSFAMHQRSNREALGDLETSFNATIAEIQETQERILALEKDLDASQDALAEAKMQQKTLTVEAEAAQAARDAMMNLYFLEDAFQSEDYETCGAIITFMEEHDQVKHLNYLLDQGGTEGIFPQGVVVPSFWNPPRATFDTLKSEVAARLAQENPAG